ncbi:MAG: flagellar hook-basal body complex protein FliE [Mariprofundaceae bacterium]|nr:flagellar hook-basal body complex protein FliE [Mariprofundaceae bacterium]
MNIQSYGPHINKPDLNAVSSQGKVDGQGSFGSVLKQYTEQMNHDVKAAAQQAETLAITGEGNMSETLLAVKQAGLSFQLMLAARNKVMDAYREVMRMQV